MKHLFFAPTISYFQYLVIMVALAVSHATGFTPWSILAWFGVLIAGSIIEGLLTLEVDHG